MCVATPPAIPTNVEYTLEDDDGFVVIDHYEYPQLSSPLNGLHHSTFAVAEIPQNYNTTLRLLCNYYFCLHKI